HATHFVQLLRRIALTESVARGGDVVVSPFDTELFGHWWFEGPDFLSEVYRRFPATLDVRPTTASMHLRDRTPITTLELAAGSWGANGDYSMWLNEETVWTWHRLWPLENAFWDAAPAALAVAGARPILAQAARGLLVAPARRPVSGYPPAHRGRDRFPATAEGPSRTPGACEAVMQRRQSCPPMYERIIFSQ